MRAHRHMNHYVNSNMFGTFCMWPSTSVPWSSVISKYWLIILVNKTIPALEFFACRYFRLVGRKVARMSFTHVSSTVPLPAVHWRPRWVCWCAVFSLWVSLSHDYGPVCPGYHRDVQCLEQVRTKQTHPHTKVHILRCCPVGSNPRDCNVLRLSGRNVTFGVQLHVGFCGSRIEMKLHWTVMWHSRRCKQ